MCLCYIDDVVVSLVPVVDTFVADVVAVVVLCQCWHEGPSPFLCL